MSEIPDSEVQDISAPEEASVLAQEQQVSHIYNLSFAPPVIPDDDGNFNFVRAVSRFSDIVNEGDTRFSVKLRKLLDLGRAELGQDNAALSRVLGLEFEVIAAIARRGSETKEQQLRKGFRYSVVNSYCGLAIRQNEPISSFDSAAECVVFNEYSTYLGCIVKVDGKTYGVLSFCRKSKQDKDFSEEEKLFVKVLARYLGNELGRARSQQALTFRIEFEKLLAAISRDFINLGPNEMDLGIYQALERIAEFSGVDMSYVFLFRDENTMMDISHWWMKDNGKPNFQTADIPLSSFPWSMRKILKREVVVMTEFDQMPIEASHERSFIKSQGLKTAILVPLLYSGKVLGWLALPPIIKG